MSGLHLLTSFIMMYREYHYEQELEADCESRGVMLFDLRQESGQYRYYASMVDQEGQVNQENQTNSPPVTVRERADTIPSLFFSYTNLSAYPTFSQTVSIES